MIDVFVLVDCQRLLDVQMPSRGKIRRTWEFEKEVCRSFETFIDSQTSNDLSSSVMTT